MPAGAAEEATGHIGASNRAYNETIDASRSETLAVNDACRAVAEATGHTAASNQGFTQG
jgi:hypothetical protein